MRKPLETRVRAVRRPMLVEYRFDWALTEARLVTTENEAMCDSSVKRAPGVLAGPAACWRAGPLMGVRGGHPHTPVVEVIDGVHGSFNGAPRTASVRLPALSTGRAALEPVRRAGGRCQSGGRTRSTSAASARRRETTSVRRPVAPPAARSKGRDAARTQRPPRPPAERRTSTTAAATGPPTSTGSPAPGRRCRSG